jgi:diacylglycerol O-acyltransferase / wax synthase
MRVMSPQDAWFLHSERREHPFHIGGLLLFVPPRGSGRGYAREVYEYLLAQTDVRSLFRTRPARPVGSLGRLMWTTDEEIELEYHVRLSAVPQPGRFNEVLSLVSQLHGALLDRNRPLWEVHVIEGLSDGRLGMYVKIHHSLADGVAAGRLMFNSLSPDSTSRNYTAFWSPTEPKTQPGAQRRNSLSTIPASVAVFQEAAGLASAAARLVAKALRSDDIALPLAAPRTILNVEIGGARQFAAASFRRERLRSVTAATGATLNDVVLAMCSGALRAYLMENDALPEASLTAAVPVSLRSISELASNPGGNALTVMLTKLGTNLPDAADRLDTIRRSTGESKDLLRRVGNIPATIGGLLIGAPVVIEPILGLNRIMNPSFNICLANISGPTDDLYLNGARLDGAYPVSYPLDGQALNITVTSRAGFFDFGLTACRQSVRRLDRLVTFLDDAIAELEKAVGAK